MRGEGRIRTQVPGRASVGACMKTRAAKRVLTAFLAGAVMVSSAWAGAGLVPAPEDDPVTKAAGAPAATETATEPTPASAPPDASAADGRPDLGARRVLAPRGPGPRGRRQDVDQAAAGRLRRYVGDAQGAVRDAERRGLPGARDATRSRPATTSPPTGSPWPENPNCIYMGGFGLGPMNPVTSWNEELGLWVARRRAARPPGRRPRPGRARRRGLLLGLRQEVRRLRHQAAHRAARRRRGPRPRRRGHRRRGDARALLARLHRRLGLRAGLVHGAGRRHDQGDGPRRRRVDAPRGPRVRRARGARVQPRAPQHLPLGRGAAARLAARVRARQTSGKGKKTTTTPPRRSPRVGAYAAHPVSFGTNGGEAHPDWPGLFEKSLEQRFGGVGLHFMTGLGNMSACRPRPRPRRARSTTGADDLAGLVAASARATASSSPTSARRARRGPSR